MTDPVKPLVQLLAPKRTWHPSQPSTAVELATATRTLGIELPAAHVALLEVGGGEIVGPRARLYLDGARDLVTFNTAPQWLADLTDMLVFGSDVGDFVYYYDVHDHMGQGAWAIYIVEIGVATRAGSTYVARDLRELIERILAGNSP
jgi:hypothetical protein